MFRFAALGALFLLVGCATPASAPVAASHRGGGNLVTRGVPDVPSDVVAALARYQNTRAAYLQDWWGDGVLVGTRFGNTAQLHQVDAPLGMRRQLSFFPEPVGGAAARPVGTRPGFVFLKDVGGSEFYQLFWQEASGGPACLLSDGRSRYIAPLWSPSGGWLGYSTTERNGVDWDLHALSPEGGRVVLQEGAGVGWTLLDWSPDESRLLISRYISAHESRLYEMEVASGQRTRLLPDVTAAFGAARYGEDESVYFTSDMDGEFRRLHRLDRVTGEVAPLTAQTPWDVESFAISQDRTRLAYSVNEEGVSRLFALRLPDARFIALPAVPAGIISGLRFHPDGEQLAFTLRSASTPADVFSIDFRSRAFVRWTHSELGGLDSATLAEPDLVRYESFDGLSIPAFVYRPRGAGPHPVIVNIHGGPESQARPSFSPTTQFYVNELGAAVIYPNVRGSRGYGKTYLRLDNGRKREDSVRDIGALLDWIATVPDLDADRVAVSGGSYGGYMVLASLVHYGHRLRAGVDRVGISNFVTFLTNTQPYRRDPAPGGIRRRTRSVNAPVSRGHLAAGPRQRDRNAAAHFTGAERPAGAGRRIGADRRGAARPRRAGVVCVGERRRARIPQEDQPRLPDGGDRAVSLAAAAGRRLTADLSVWSKRRAGVWPT